MAGVPISFHATPAGIRAACPLRRNGAVSSSVSGMTGGIAIRFPRDRMGHECQVKRKKCGTFRRE